MNASSAGNPKTVAGLFDERSNEPPSRSGLRASHVRYGVLGFTFAMSLLLYLDRFALSVALPVIGKELRLTNEQLGIATGAFFYVYALAQVPAGWFSDRFGGRVTLTLYVVFWSLALGGMGLIVGLASLAVLRGMLGLAQAGAYPCAASVLKCWFPVHRRGMANTVTTMGGRTGNMLANVLTPLLMGQVALWIGWTTGQWRWVFFLYGVLGLVWAAAFWRWFRDQPADHPACNEAEQHFIGRRERQAAGGVSAPPLLAMAACPTIYFLCGISVFVNVGWIFLVTFLPTYLSEVHQYRLSLVGLLAAIPGVASMCGGVSGGLATDFLVRRVGLSWGRRLTGLIATMGAGLAYCGCLIASDPIVVVGLFAAAAFLIDFGLGSLWAVYQDIAGKHVASVLGFGNMCGNLAAGVFPQIIGRYADRDEWNSVFAVSAAALFVTATCWLFVNPTAPLRERETRGGMFP